MQHEIERVEREADLPQLKRFERLGWTEAVEVAQEPPGWNKIVLFHGLYLGQRIDDSIGTTHAWRKAGFASLDRHSSQLGRQPLFRVVWNGVAAALFTGQQIAEIYAALDAERANWFTGQWYQHPTLGTLTASVEFLAQQSGRYEPTVRQILQSVEATRHPVQLYHGKTIDVFSAHALAAGLTWERWLGQGKERIAADPITGRVIGSVLAWCRHLGVANVDHLRRRLRTINVSGERDTPSDAQSARLYTDRDIRRAWPELFDQPQLMVQVTGRVIDPKTGRRYVHVLGGARRTWGQTTAQLRVRAANGRPTLYFAEDEVYCRRGLDVPVITDAERAAELALVNPYAAAGGEVDRLLEEAQAFARIPQMTVDAEGFGRCDAQEAVPRSVLSALEPLIPEGLRPAFQVQLLALEPIGRWWMSWPGHWEKPVLLEGYGRHDYERLRDQVDAWIVAHGSGLKSSAEKLSRQPKLVRLETGEYVPEPQASVLTPLVSESDETAGLLEHVQQRRALHAQREAIGDKRVVWLTDLDPTRQAALRQAELEERAQPSPSGRRSVRHRGRRSELVRKRVSLKKLAVGWKR